MQTGRKVNQRTDMVTYVIPIFFCVFSLPSFSIAQKEVGDVVVGCPRGSYWNDGLCYSVSTLSANFEDAELTCEMGGGSLVMVRSINTHNFIDRLRLRKFFFNYWIGLNDREKEGSWMYGDKTPLLWFKRWGPGEPNNNKGQQHCAKMQMARNLLWDDDNCDRQWFYICQFEGDNCTYRAGTRLGSYCFELSDDIATFDDAEQNCRSKGGYLVNLKSPIIYDFVKRIIYANRKWTVVNQTQMTNIYRQHNNRIPAVWIGVRYFRGKWILSDNSVANFTQWAPNEPNNAKKEEDCVVMIQNWHDVTCDTVRNFACQYNVSFETTPAPAPTTPTPMTTPPMTTPPTTVPPIVSATKSILVPATTVTTTVASEAPPIGAAFISQPVGLNLSINHFACLLFVFFVLGSIFTICFGGVVVYSRRLRKKFDSNRHDDQQLRIIEQDYNDKM